MLVKAVIIGKVVIALDIRVDQPISLNLVEIKDENWTLDLKLEINGDVKKIRVSRDGTEESVWLSLLKKFIASSNK